MSGSPSLTSESPTLMDETPAGREPAGLRPAPTPALPRLLAGLESHEAMSLDDHLAIHGDIALHRGRGRAREGEHLIEEIEHSGLRGHGGGGFPVAESSVQSPGRAGARSSSSTPRRASPPVRRIARCFRRFPIS